MRVARIALVGDRRDSVPAHVCIPTALRMAEERLGVRVEHEWIASNRVGDAKITLRDYSGIWAIPGSPYVSMDGALDAIQLARTERKAFLGTCGGFQHALIEFSRHVAHLPEADHTESNPGTSEPVVAALACSLVGQTGLVRFVSGSKIAAAYDADSVNEVYRCSYGLNARYREALEKAGLRFTAFDENGEPRAAELPEHPFFVGTLFQPERATEQDGRPLLVTAFVAAAARE